MKANKVTGKDLPVLYRTLNLKFDVADVCEF